MDFHSQKSIELLEYQNRFDEVKAGGLSAFRACGGLRAEG